MSTFLGLISWEQELLKEHSFTEVFSELSYWNPDRTEIWSNEGAFFGQHSLLADEQINQSPSSISDTSSEYAIVADVSLYYKEELLNELELELDFFWQLSDEDLILKAYQKWGDNCIEHLFGDFAFAIWEKSKRTLFCARDHIGCKPFFFYHDKFITIISSDIEAIRTLNKEPSFKVSDLWMGRYLTLSRSGYSQTQYESIRRLEPAHKMMIEGMDIEICKYWNLESRCEENTNSEEQIICDLYRAFEKAIEERCKSHKKIGIELSGGLDSSSIAFTAFEVLENKTFFSYSHVVDAASKELGISDEREDIDIVLGHLEFVKSSFIDFAGAGIISSFEKGLELSPHPIYQGFSVFSGDVHQLASEDGCSILLSGFGGDEFVTIKTAVYLKELANNAKWKLLWRFLRMRNGSNYYRTIVSFLDYFLGHLKRKIRTNIAMNYVLHFRKAKSRYNLAALSKDMLEKFPEALFNDIQQNTSINSYSKNCRNSLSSPHISERIEATYFAALSKKIEYKYPLLDVKLLEFFYNIPSEMKYKYAVPRDIFKQSILGHIPNAILRNNKKNILSIPSLWIQIKRDVARVNELILDCKENNQYDYLDYEKLKINVNAVVEAKRMNDIGFLFGYLLVDLNVLILQKWQREGKIDIGIKC